MCNTHSVGMNADLGYEQFLDSKTLSDITIRYGKNGERVFHGHKIVFCSNSHWFKAALLSGFKESDSNEITLHEDDPEALNAMLRFMYNPDDYFEESSTTTDNLSFALKLFEVADKYHVPDLFDETIELFSTYFQDAVREIDDEVNVVNKDALIDIVNKTYQLAGSVSSTRQHPLVHELCKVLLAQGYLGLTKGEPLQRLLVLLAEKNAEFGRDVFLHAFDGTMSPGEPVFTESE